MIEILKKELQSFKTNEEKFNHLRELLQILILKIIFDAGLFKNIIFVGGTALRILFDLQRFSEDLDFSLINKKGYSLNRLSKVIRGRLLQYNLKSEMTIKEKKTVHELMIKFTKILYDMELSRLPGQKLFIKLEIDTNPPQGGNIEISVINKLFMFTIPHFDLSSLYATKLAACFFRSYTKGRDFYDLLWYLTKRIKPHFSLLNNAIKQSQGGEHPQVNEANFHEFMLKHIVRINFTKVRQDVERFLVNKDESNLLSRENFINLIEKKIIS